jgi:hypothetical protein
MVVSVLFLMGVLQKPRNTPEHWSTTPPSLKRLQIDGCDDEVGETWLERSRTVGTGTGCDDRGPDDSPGAACHGMGDRTRQVSDGQTQMDAALAFSAGIEVGRCVSTLRGCYAQKYSMGREGQGLFWVRVQIGREQGDARDRSKPRAIAVAVARALKIQVDD